MENDNNSKNNNNEGQIENADFNYYFENAPDANLQTAFPEVRTKTSLPKHEQTQSKWMNWSKNRRISYQERMKKLEERLLAEEKLKHNTSRQAIKKAKKEASKFIVPEYASKMKEEKLRTVSARVDERPKIFESDSESEDEDSLRKAAEELKEAPIVDNFRKIGFFFSVVALVLISSGLGLEHWTTHGTYKVTIYRGLWSQTLNVTTTSGKNEEDLDREDWQTAVIGLLASSGIMNVLGCLLALSGLCSVLFLKKLYYFHSAAEAFVVSAISMGCAVLVFFVMYKSDTSLPLLGIGTSPGFCCTALFLQVLAAIIMNLDIIIFQVQRCSNRK